jgi:hypothetical protein
MTGRELLLARGVASVGSMKKSNSSCATNGMLVMLSLSLFQKKKQQKKK